MISTLLTLLVLGVIGVNYYVHNQWIYPGGHGTMIEPSHPRYRPVWQMLQEVYERYRRPLLRAGSGTRSGIEELDRQTGPGSMNNHAKRLPAASESRLPAPGPAACAASR